MPFVNKGDNSVSTYVVDTHTGRLKWIDEAATGSAPVDVATDLSGKYAYVANFTSGDVSAYSIGNNGALTQISCGAAGTTGCIGSTGPTNFAAGAHPNSLTIDPSGKYVYVANNGGTLSQYTIGSNGELVPMSTATVSAGSSPIRLTVDPSGNYVYVADLGGNDVSAFSVGSSGALTKISCGGATSLCNGTNFPAGGRPESVAVDPSDHFVYVANAGNSGTRSTVSQYSIRTDGSLAFMGTVTARFGAAAVVVLGGTSAVQAVPKYAYVANEGDSTVSAFTIASDGSLEPLLPSGRLHQHGRHGTGSHLHRRRPVGQVCLRSKSRRWPSREHRIAIRDQSGRESETPRAERRCYQHGTGGDRSRGRHRRPVGALCLCGQ